ncbi:hypothetical protein DALLNEIH_00077 [Bacillus sp. B01(2024)]|uniref:hypothetical protein n=1 Tax=Bacillus siamensis TaxID=659243 RepID=UPI0039E18AA7
MGKKSKVYYCDPKYIVTDTYTDKEVVYVYQEETIHEVIDPGDPGKCGCKKQKKRHKK